MNTMKKAFALVLTLAIVMSLGLAAVAAPTTDPTITVVNDSKQVSIIGQTITAYKLFDLSWDGADSYTYTPVAELTGYSYTPDGAHEAITADTLKDYLESIAADPIAVAAFAKDMQTQPVLAKLPKLEVAAKDETEVLDVKKTPTNNLGLGYYLITVTPKNMDGLGVANTPAISIALDTTDYAPEVHVKSEAPAIDKTVKEGSTYTDAAVTREVGSKAEFKLETKVPNTNGYETYQFDMVDTLSKGLKLDASSFKVTINGTEVKDYTLDAKDGGFTLNFGADFKAYMKKYNETLGNTPFAIGDPIVVTYAATVTAEGLKTNHQNNAAHIVYSNDPTVSGQGRTGTTPDDKVHVYEFGLNLDKVDGGASHDKLEGAIFVLKNNEDTQKFYKYNSDNTISWVDTADDATQLYSKDGKLFEYDAAKGTAGTVATTFKGLKAGTYHIDEIKAPDGYVELEKDIDLTITTTPNAKDNTLKSATFTYSGAVSGTYTVDQTANFSHSLTVTNNAGNRLPSTGGIGTTIFYTVGAILMASALVLMITKKKMSVN